MLFIGSDPDTSVPSLAAVDERGVVIFVWVGSKAKGTSRGRAAVLDSFGPLQRTLLDSSSLLGNLRLLQAQTCPPEWWVEAIAVEGQEVYKSPGRTKNPQSIVLLAGSAGAVLGTMSMGFPTASLYYPAPKDWKGSVPKLPHHGHIYAELGWTGVKKGGQEPYLVPVEDSMVPKPLGLDTVENASSWKHLNDSIGLALWCRKRWLRDNRIKDWKESQSAVVEK